MNWRRGGPIKHPSNQNTRCDSWAQGLSALVAWEYVGVCRHRNLAMATFIETRRYPRMKSPEGLGVAWQTTTRELVSPVETLGLGGLFIRTQEPPERHDYPVDDRDSRRGSAGPHDCSRHQAGRGNGSGNCRYGPGGPSTPRQLLEPTTFLNRSSHQARLRNSSYLSYPCPALKGKSLSSLVG